jgi:MFS family permease
MLSRTQRSARRRIWLAFFLAGWLTAAWATRIPAIKEALGLSAGQLAVAILGLEAGAILGLPAGAALIGRVGSRRALRAGLAGVVPALPLVGLAYDLATLAAALAAMAFTNSIVDVAMNAQGIELERRTDRSLLSGLHAGHPLGMLAGGLTGTAAAAIGVSVAVHFALVAAAALLPAWAAGRFLLHDRAPRGSRAFARPSRRLLLLGLLAFCAFALDGVAFNWSGVVLRSEHAAPEALAAAAFAGFALALAAGRLVVDRLISRFGRVSVVRGGAWCSAAGGLLVVFAPSAEVALAGWAFVGLGVSGLAPALLAAAPQVASARPAVAVATVTTLGYLGSFSAPPIIGAASGLTGLSAALGGVVLLSAVLATLAHRALRTGSDAPHRSGLLTFTPWPTATPTSCAPSTTIGAAATGARSSTSTTRTWSGAGRTSSRA